MSGTLLFSPMTIRGVELKNRIVVPPMHQYSAVKGFPTDWHLMNAGKFAAGGAGLVVVESTKVERRGCGTVGDLGIWDDAFVEPLSRLVKFIHQQNSVTLLYVQRFGSSKKGQWRILPLHLLLVDHIGKSRRSRTLFAKPSRVNGFSRSGYPASSSTRSTLAWLL